MPSRRDVAAFEQRAASYDQGWLGRLHHEIAGRTVTLAASVCAAPDRVLDVGCGTGYLLRLLARQWPHAGELAGIDPAPAMIDAAARAANDPRIRLSVGVAERLPHPDNHFDLVVTTTSFDHWADQPAGLRECARVLRPGGSFVLVDQFSRWLVPTLVAGRRHKARTPERASLLLTAVGFRSITWHDLYAVIIKAAAAVA